MQTGGKAGSSEVLWTVSGTELTVVITLCLVLAFRKKNKCMGIVQVLIVGLAVWFWNWAILSLDDQSEDVLVENGKSGGSEGLGSQVWNKPPSAEALVREWYDRVLDPRRPTSVHIEIHPAGGRPGGEARTGPELQPGEGQADREKIVPLSGGKCWKSQKGLDPV